MRELSDIQHLALRRLVEGNARYAASRPTLDASLHRRAEVTSGQSPFAAVLGCVDSRVPPELVFDQGLGHLLVARAAGLVVDQAIMASLQFAVAELHVPLLVVLGHQGCGAVQGAIHAAERGTKPGGALSYLVQALAPAVAQAKSMGGDLWEQAGRAQVHLQVKRLRQSPELAPFVTSGAVLITGGWYHLDTGLVDFLEG